MKPTMQIMSAPLAHHQKPTARCVSVISPFLRHLNTGTLAMIMFIAFALLTNTRGNDTETSESVPAAAIKSEIVIDKYHDNVPHAVTEAIGQTMSPPPNLLQFMSGIFSVIKGAFNDPSLSEYAKQQGMDISDSLTTPCPNTPATSRSLSSQLSRPSSSY